MPPTRGTQRHLVEPAVLGFAVGGIGVALGGIAIPTLGRKLHVDPIVAKNV